MTGGVLVIKLAALGDFVQALGPMRAIRDHHPTARLTLLTTQPFAGLAEATGWFDDIWIDDRPSIWRIGHLRALARRLRGGHFARVYDLQTSDRSSSYHRLFGRPRPEWSGIARGCSHPHANPDRDSMHTLDRQAEQLRMAGIDRVPAPDLSWAPDVDPARFGIVPPFALLVPGAAAHRPAKRWPADHYGALAARLAADGVRPVILGTEAERDVARDIVGACPAVRSLLGVTSLLDIAALARHATLAVGNDSGPMHLIAVAGGRCLVLFSGQSDPALCAPRGPAVTLLERPVLADLPIDAVLAAIA